MKCSCMSILLLLAASCADIRPKPGQTIEDFCEDWAFMRPWTNVYSARPHGFYYWKHDCLWREYAAEAEKDPPGPEW